MKYWVKRSKWDYELPVMLGSLCVTQISVRDKLFRITLFNKRKETLFEVKGLEDNIETAKKTAVVEYRCFLRLEIKDLRRVK